jgi:hypothetical protein
MLGLLIGTCADDLLENAYPKNPHFLQRKLKGSDRDIPE